MTTSPLSLATGVLHLGSIDAFRHHPLFDREFFHEGIQHVLDLRVKRRLHQVPKHLRFLGFNARVNLIGLLIKAQDFTR